MIVMGFLEPLGLTPNELAERMSISTDEMDNLLDNEIPCTPRLAGLLEKALGLEASFWLSAQNIYDAWLKREGLYQPSAAN
jgi:addiction module HigA family antidote